MLHVVTPMQKSKGKCKIQLPAKSLPVTSKNYILSLAEEIMSGTLKGR